MNTDKIVKALQERFDKITGAYEVMSALAEARREEIESLATQLAELQRRTDAAVEYCKSPHYGDGDYYCGIDSASQEVLDILRGPVAGEESR